MCGIFGYIGRKESLPFLIEGLKRLEYRGYDSAGIAVLNEEKIFIAKCAGKIGDLEKILLQNPLCGKVGLGHTRWATHGSPSYENAHPQIDCGGNIALIHNGIIENHDELRRKLISEGHSFRSNTDTEVIVHLIEKYMEDGLENAIRTALSEINGSYAIAAISGKEGDKIVVARYGSPLIIGLGEDEAFISSDIPALIKYTGKIIQLENNEIGIVGGGDVKITDIKGQQRSKKINLVSWDPVSAEKNGYTHFMLKEIHEQPKAIRSTIAERINLETGEIYFDELEILEEELKGTSRVIFTACGTSFHAGLIGKYLIEQFVEIPGEVEYAAEFRYRHPVLDGGTLVIAISQSGETADTIGAVCEAKERNAKVLSICNVQGSSIARESHGVIYTHAGPEIGVASTKAFTTQLAIIYLFSIYLGLLKGVLTKEESTKLISDLTQIPHRLQKILSKEREIEELAERFYKNTNALYLGRGKGFPVALEGALKLKEVSYIHAEGYPAAEMKHGPIALIDKNMPVVVMALQGRRYEKILGNIEEIKARGGIVIAIATEGDKIIKEKADEVIYIPDTTESLSPILAIMPLQLFAYYTAVKRGCSVDQPRNLAKSVTVE